MQRKKAGDRIAPSATYRMSKIYWGDWGHEKKEKRKERKGKELRSDACEILLVRDHS